MSEKKMRDSEEGVCLVCKRINQIKRGENPYFIAELETGYLVLEDYQHYTGYVIFLCKECKSELHQLERAFRLKFLEEMSQVAEAVFLARQPKKMNIELLGNKHPHLHWHIIPRRDQGGEILKPIWCTDERVRHSEAFWLFDGEIGDTERLKNKIITCLRQVRGE